jgi:DoxX-like family
MQKSGIIIWLLKIVAATIMLQTLFFKFTAAPESVYIFSMLHAEPYGRIGSGIIELIASILLIIPRTTFIGAMLGLGTMTGAILSHLFILGISVQNDGGQLFVLGLITALCCAIVAFKNKHQLADIVTIGRKIVSAKA